MKSEIQINGFSPDSKLWVYQSDRAFSDQEIQQLNSKLEQFAATWTAHQLQLKATGFVYADRIIILMADETQAGTSGCSVDTSVRFIKSLGEEFNTDFFNRNLVNYISGEKMVTTTLDQLHTIAPETNVIDPLVNSKRNFDDRFILPLQQSWMNQFV